MVRGKGDKREGRREKSRGEIGKRILWTAEGGEELEKRMGESVKGEERVEEE